MKTQNYTFRKDGRAFFNYYKTLTARPATDAEIEKWLSRQKKHVTKRQQSSDDEPPAVVLARYLASVNAEEWARLGMAQLKKIRAALEKL